MSAIEADRTWAIGLDQDEFEREWVSKFPMSDVIPDVTAWPYLKEPDYGGIDGVNPSDLLADNEEAEKEKPKDKTAPPLPEINKPKGPQKGEYPCRGCGKVFEYILARAGHERHCKVALNTKVEG